MKKLRFAVYSVALSLSTTLSVSAETQRVTYETEVPFHEQTLYLNQIGNMNGCDIRVRFENGMEIEFRGVEAGQQSISLGGQALLLTCTEEKEAHYEIVNF